MMGQIYKFEYKYAYILRNGIFRFGSIRIHVVLAIANVFENVASLRVEQTAKRA
jgi:hypothetical protein